MTTVDFLTEKNKIVFRVTNVVLVPTGQLEEVPFRELDEIRDGCEQLNDTICPYCLEYAKPGEGSGCAGCPMAEAGNHCDYDVGDTWTSANNQWLESAEVKDHQELIALCEQYNKEGYENAAK